MKESVPEPSSAGALWMSRPSDGQLVRKGHEVWAMLNINGESWDNVTYYPMTPGIMQRYPVGQRIELANDASQAFLRPTLEA
jgi:hypothetical protein